MAGAEMRSTNQQPSRNGMLPTTIDLEVDPFPVKPSDETPVLANTFATALWETLKERTQLNQTQTFNT